MTGFNDPAVDVPWALDKKKPSQAYIKTVFGKGFKEILKWPESSALKQDVAKWDATIPYNMPTSEDIKRLPFNPKTKTFRKFYELGNKSQTLNVLLTLWNYRENMKTVGTKENFIKFLFHKSTSATAAKWVKALIARKAVLYKSIQFKAEAMRRQGVVVQKKTTVTRGSNNALRGALAVQFLDVAALGMVNDDDLFCCFLAAFLSSMLGIRDVTLFTLQIMSDVDFETLKRNAKQSGMDNLGWGLFIVVKKDSYRLELYQSKTRSAGDYNPNADSGDMVLEGTEEFKAIHPFLERFVDMLIEVFRKRTGYRVTATSRQPRVYISDRKYNGKFQMLQNHYFPHFKPEFKYGNKHGVSIKVPFIGDSMWTTADPTKILTESEIKARVWQSSKVSERLAKMTATVSIDGKDSEENLCIMEHCVPWVPQLHSHFPPNKGSASTSRPIQAMMKLLTERTKALIHKNSYNGKIGLISGKPMNDSSLQVIANSNLCADFTSFGRHFKGHRLLQVRHYFSNCTDPTVREQLNTDVGKLAKQENHVNEKVLEFNYAAYKNPEYASFTSISL